MGEVCCQPNWCVCVCYSLIQKHEIEEKILSFLKLCIWTMYLRMGWKKICPAQQRERQSTGHIPAEMGKQITQFFRNAK